MKKYIIIILFFIICCAILCVYEPNQKTEIKKLDIAIPTVDIQFAYSEEFEKAETIGILEIPSINLKDEVKEGTTNDVIDENIGHFENTNVWFGNIAICAHNNGYSKNHFKNLYRLKKGDEVIYSTKFGTRTYIVDSSLEISETDLHILEETSENKITMITCITNKPEKRLCVQAIEKS